MVHLYKLAWHKNPTNYLSDISAVHTNTAFQPWIIDPARSTGKDNMRSFSYTKEVQRVLPPTTRTAQCSRKIYAISFMFTFWRQENTRTVLERKQSCFSCSRNVPPLQRVLLFVDQNAAIKCSASLTAWSGRHTNELTYSNRDPCSLRQITH